MAGLFDTFTTANRGLAVMQNAISTSSHNIANVTTTGYSRQRVQIETTRPFGGNSKYAILTAGQVGTGAEATAIQRIRNTFIDYRVREATTDVGTAEIKNQYYSKIENVLGEISTKGIQGALSSMYASFQELTGSTDTPANRKDALSSAESLTALLNSRYTQLKDLTSDAQTELKNTVNDINAKLDNIRDLNQEILRISSLGMSANDLMDKRDLLIDELSSKFGVDVDRESYDRIELKATEGLNEGEKLVSKDYTDTTYKRFSYVDSIEDGGTDAHGRPILKINYMKLGSPNESAKETLEITCNSAEEAEELKKELETNRVLEADYEGYIGRTYVTGTPEASSTDTEKVFEIPSIGTVKVPILSDGSMDVNGITVTGSGGTAVNGVEINCNDNGSVSIKVGDNTANVTTKGYEVYQSNPSMDLGSVLDFSNKYMFKTTEGEIAGYQVIQSEIDYYMDQLDNIAASIAYCFNIIQTGDASGNDMNNLIFVVTDPSESKSVSYDSASDKYTFGGVQYSNNGAGEYVSASGDKLNKFYSGSNDTIYELIESDGTKTQYKLNSDGDEAFLLTDKGINAGNISINGVLFNDTTKLNCGETDVSGEGDGNRALAMAKIADLKILFTKMTKEDFADRNAFLNSNAGISFDDDGMSLRGNSAGSTISGKYNTEITNLGTKVNSSETALESAEYTQSVALNDRDQESGVSLDEEMTDMIKFNHAYQANAKVISTVSSLLDVIIGLV